MWLYKTPEGPMVRSGETWHAVAEKDWDALINKDQLLACLAEAAKGPAVAAPKKLLAPIGSQEVWAAGVTYFRSRTARMEESKDAGGADFYDKVYHADRPELFFKATAQRVVGDGGSMHLRGDSKWIVPEPELTLVINAAGKIVGYTVGNDLSCRDIEGENPLYLPQAKVFDRCAGVGPGIYVTDQPLPDSTEIRCVIERGGKTVFEGATAIDQLKKKPPQLVSYLYRDSVFATGALLMTGTGVVPPDDFCLIAGDVVRITIEPIGTLNNPMD